MKMIKHLFVELGKMKVTKNMTSFALSKTMMYHISHFNKQESSDERKQF